MSKVRVFGVIVAVAALLVGSGDVLAGTTGKVNGVIRDSAGEVLPGANVVIKELNLGATADADGYYVIINITPGSYTLTGSLIGYETVSVTGVRMVADQTTTIDFALKETALELGELVVTAGRPLVEPDKTATKYTVGVEETERALASARSTGELLQLQPGVSVDGSGRLRGSRNVSDGWSNFGNDVAYMVDGIRMSYNDNRGKSEVAGVNRGSIQELSVITGVTPAEYGNAQGGVISVVTKEGGTSYNGWVEFRYEPSGYKHWGENVYDAPELQNNVKWDDPDWRNERWPDLSEEIPFQASFWKEMAGELIHKRTDYEEQSGYGVEASIAGPVGDQVSFVITGKHSRFANAYPGAERTGFYDDGGTFWQDPGNINISGSATFRATPNLKIKVGGFYQGWDDYSDTRLSAAGKSRETATLPGGRRGTGNNLFLPEKWSANGKQTYNEQLQYAVITHTVSPKTFYEVRLSRSASNRDTSGSFADTTKANYTDQAGYFNIGRQVGRYGLSDRERLGLKFDLSSQVTKGNFIKMGVEFLYAKIALFERWDSSTSSRAIAMMAEHQVPDEPEKPYFINLYAQDKMEFQGMIVNVGVRMDALNPNSRALTFGTFRGTEQYRWLTTRQEYAYEDGNLWSTKAPWHVNFSPRIGVAHPITERSQLRFSTGVFLQYADMWYYFGEDYWTEAAASDFDINANGRIDDTERYNSFFTTYSGVHGLHLIRPMKTTAFEVGADWNFVSDYTATLTAYYKSEVDHFTTYPNETWVGARVTGIRYSRTLDNGAHGDTRGMEFSVRKAFSNNFSFSASYNYQWAQTMTGKRGNVIRNGYTDSLTVARLANLTMFTDPDANVPVYGYWVEWTNGADGRRIPKRMTTEDIEFYGHQGENYVRNSAKRYQLLGTGYYEGVRIIDGPLGEYGVMINTGSYTTLFLSPKSGDRRHFGSVNMLASFPDDYEFGHPLVGSLLKNVRLNVTSRIQTGTIYNYTPPTGGVASQRSRPMDSRTDLSIEKTFNVAGRVQPTLFADIRNVFDQKDRNSPSSTTDWTYLGIDGPTPVDNNYLTYGDSRDRSYAHRPRTAHFGLRMNW